VNDLIPAGSGKVLDPVENASKNMDAEDSQEQQLYCLEDSRSKVDHSIIFHLPAHDGYQEKAKIQHGIIRDGCLLDHFDSPEQADDFEDA
jgi:hypothetical protein